MDRRGHDGAMIMRGTRPISAAPLLAAAGLMLLIALPVLRSKREEAFQEEA